MLYKLWAVQIGSTVLRGVREVALEANATQIVEAADGSVYRSLTALTEFKPTFRFTTCEVGIAVGLIGVAGVGISSNVVKLYYAQIKNEGTTETVGMEITISGGIIAPETLSLQQGQLATLSVIGVMCEDGDTAPHTVVGSTTLPTEDEIAEGFTLGEIKINSIAVTGVQSANINFGCALEQAMGSGKVYPSECYLNGYNPAIDVTTDDAAKLAVNGFEGTDHLVTVQAKKLQNCGTIAATGHKVFSTHKSSVRVDGVSGSHGQRATAMLKIQPVKVDSNHPITVA